MRIIAYAYNGALYCPDCSDNEVRSDDAPMFSTDEGGQFGDYCDTCSECINEPWPTTDDSDDDDATADESAEFDDFHGVTIEGL